jgi:hypothetical protein
MARFKLVEGDAIALTKAYNALTAGVGTTPTPGDAAAFVAAWTHSPLAFASDSGFVALVLSSPRAAVATIAPYAEDFGAEAGELCRALLVAYELLLIQASAITPSGDSLLESTGFRFDGCCRR